VYSWGQKPELLPYEGGMTKPSLPVIMSDNRTILDKASRIYYGIHHPIQYNNKVKDIGYIPRDFIPTLIGNWREEDESDTQQEAEVTANAELSDEEEEEERDREERETELHGSQSLSGQLQLLSNTSFNSHGVESEASSQSGTIALLIHVICN
jgi:hypothetical protein